MRHAYWARSQSQHLLPTVPLTAPPRRTGWQLAAALLACGAVFLVDVALPGIVVGLLYSLILVVLARAGRPWWLAVVCALGTLLHAIAGIFDLPVAELPVVLANRGLAILVLWAVGCWIAVNLARSGSRPPAPWRAVAVE